MNAAARAGDLASAESWYEKASWQRTEVALLTVASK